MSPPFDSYGTTIDLDSQSRGRRAMPHRHATLAAADLPHMRLGTPLTRPNRARSLGSPASLRAHKNDVLFRWPRRGRRN